MILTTPISGAMAWRGTDFPNNNAWEHHLTDLELRAIEQALNDVTRKGLAYPHLKQPDFSVPALTPTLDRITHDLEHEHGFFLLRGLPVQRYSENELKTIYYGLGLNLGTPVTQNPQGDLLGIVANVGDKNNTQTRVYETNAYLPYHTDPSDVVGLLCLRQAKTGGLSSLISAASVYNRLLNEHPEFLGLYYRPMFYAHLGDEKMSPIFSYSNGKLSCRYLRQYIELGHELHNTPLSTIEIAALDALDNIMQDPDVRLDMMLAPGDIQFANNYAVLHSRTEFKDHDDPEQHRQMLRLWLKMPNARTLAPEFPGRNGFGTPTQ